MPWSTIVIAMALFDLVLPGRVMRARAAQLLNPEQQNQVMSLRWRRAVSLPYVALYVILALTFLAAFGVFLLPVNVYVLFVVPGGVVLWAEVTYFRRLRALGLPAAYLRVVRNSLVITYCPVLLVLVIVMAYIALQNG